MAVKLQTQSATDLKHPRKQHQIEVEMHTPISLFHEFQRWSLLTRMLFVLGIPTIFFLYATSPQVVTDQTNPQYRNNGLFDVAGNVKLQIYTEHIASLEPSAIQYILKKPLFSPERRPPTAEKETPIYPIIIEKKSRR